ncbi:MAG TPA: hypothetical protein VEI06_04130 [Gemmatimonadaceae bacterium]|nr:hypothetical protein [Gemmatimonadaceae bacterium]
MEARRAARCTVRRAGASILRGAVVALVVPSAARSQMVPALADVRLPVDSLPVASRTALPKSPDWMAMAFDAVWVVNYRPSTVNRLDPRTGAVLASIPIGDNACLGIAVGPQSLWVASCGSGELTEIDPQTNSVRRRVSLPLHRRREGALAYANGFLWIPLAEPDTTGTVLGQVDPETGKLVASIAVPPASDVVVGGFGALWVASSWANSVLRVDPKTRQVTARIRVGPSPKFMAVGLGSVWVQNRHDGTVSRIDPDSAREVARIATEAPTPYGDLAVGEGAVWLSVDGRPLTRIDALNNRVSQQYVGGSGADAVRVGYGAVWIADHEHGEVWRIPIEGLR